MHVFTWPPVCAHLYLAAGLVLLLPPVHPTSLSLALLMPHVHGCEYGAVETSDMFVRALVAALGLNDCDESCVVLSYAAAAASI